MSKKIAIIGAGLGGLSAAIRLSHKGYDVDLYEQNSTAGGKANELQINGFRFDTGPSLLTMPFVLKELFEECDENFDDYIKLKPLDLICKYFYPDGSILNAYSNIDKFGKEIERSTTDNSESLKRYLKYCADIYNLTADLFLYKSPNRMSTYLSLKALKTLLNIKKIDSLRTMHEANLSFFKDKKLVQLFDRYATYNGSNPYLAPATLNIIPHVECSLRGYLPADGIYSITKALCKLAEKKGVNILLNQKVDEIIVTNNSVKAIRINQKIINYDLVVSNVDVNNTFYKLIKNISTRESRRYLKTTPSFSGVVFYWGMDRTFDQLEVHNILFSSNYKYEFENLFTYKTIPTDPTIYIYVSSKFNRNDAPMGKENWFVMINAPYIDKQDWSAELKTAKVNVVKKISKYLNVDITKHIEFERQLSPIDIQEKTGSYLGSIYGIASNSKWTAFIRQPNKSRSIKNLFFSGGSAHPGGGIPLVILSGKITADLIAKEYKL